MNVGSTSVDRVPALQAGLLGCDATGGGVALQVDGMTGKAYCDACLWPLAADEVAHDEAGFGFESFESMGYGDASLYGLVLAYLPLCFEAGDGELYANDAFCDGFDVVGGCVAYFPGKRG